MPHKHLYERLYQHPGLGPHVLDDFRGDILRKFQGADYLVQEGVHTIRVPLPNKTMVRVQITPSDLKARASVPSLLDEASLGVVTRLSNLIVTYGFEPHVARA